MIRVKNKQWLFILGLSAIIAGCNNEKDYYEDPLKNLKPENEYFDFSTKDKVSVSLNMGAVGANSIYEIYLEDPIIVKDNGLAELNSDIKPVYSNITDLTGKSNVSITLPSASKKVYLFNRNALLPGCVELEISDTHTISFNNEKENDVKSVRAIGDEGPDWYVHTDGIKYGKGNVSNAVKDKVKMTGLNELYTLCQWTNNVSISNITFTPKDYVENTLRGSKEINAFSSQATRFYPEGKNNSKYAGTPSTVNLKTSNDKDYTNINLVVLGENAGWHSPFGYFYYKAGNEPTAEDLKSNKIPKYIILPDASDNVKDSWPGAGGAIDGMFKLGQTIHLQFFGEKYNEPASYNFPKGYIIGWFVIGDGTTCSKDGYFNPEYSWSFKNSLSETKGFCTSLDTRKLGGKDVCVNFAVATNSSRSMMYIGVEDDVKTSDPDYNDLMFYVEANPLTISPDVPIMSDKEEHIKYSNKGTYAFEDQWPDGGDYDMNDVVTEYEHGVSIYSKTNFQDDKPVSTIKYVEELTATFKFTQASDAATFNNALGIEFKNLDKGIVESVTVNGTEAQLEVGNPVPSVIVATNARTAIGKTFELVIKLKQNNTLDIDNLEYNPFIVENNDGSAKGRYEVHLPKYTPTALGWNGTNINQYYVDGKNGLYPFAIDIPIWNWTLISESVAIGNEGEYPNFINWAESNGVNNKDWYLYKNGR